MTIVLHVTRLIKIDTLSFNYYNTPQKSMDESAKIAIKDTYKAKIPPKLKDTQYKDFRE